MGKTTGMTQGMAVCPVCGFDPDPIVKPHSAEELWKERTYKIFKINSEQPWWLEQTKYVCQQLKDMGLSPKRILDAGCGDGRWIYGIRAIFPDVMYAGIDRLEDHIFLNRERFPEENWIHNDFCKEVVAEWPDTIFLMGIFNPGMPDKTQDEFLNKIKLLAPDNIIVLFDYNSTGQHPHPWLKKEYSDYNIALPQEYHGPHQSLGVCRYVKR